MRGVRSIDGIQHRQVTVVHRQFAPATVPAAKMPAPATTPVSGPAQAAAAAGLRPYQFAPGSGERGGFLQRLQLPLLIGAGIISGYLVQSLWFGVAAILLYGVLSVIFRVDSRVTFALALISLLTVPVLLVARANIELASNFATYTFLLLVFGVIALSFEARPTSRKRKRRHGR
jgi:hypothetical protein